MTTVLMLPWTWGAGISSPWRKPRVGLLPVLHLLRGLQATFQSSLSLAVDSTGPQCHYPPSSVPSLGATRCHAHRPRQPFAPRGEINPAQKVRPGQLEKAKSLDKLLPRFSKEALCVRHYISHQLAPVQKLPHDAQSKKVKPQPGGAEPHPGAAPEEARPRARHNAVPSERWRCSALGHRCGFPQPPSGGPRPALGTAGLSPGQGRVPWKAPACLCCQPCELSHQKPALSDPESWPWVGKYGHSIPEIPETGLRMLLA